MLRSGKESACQYRRCKRHRFDPWAEKITLVQEMAVHSSFLVWKVPWTDVLKGVTAGRVTRQRLWLLLPDLKIARSHTEAPERCPPERTTAAWGREEARPPHPRTCRQAPPDLAEREEDEDLQRRPSPRAQGPGQDQPGPAGTSQRRHLRGAAARLMPYGPLDFDHRGNIYRNG